MKTKFIVNGEEVELELLGDDGNGSRLWLHIESDKVANESYDPETMESFGLSNEIEGWNYTKEDALV